MNFLCKKDESFQLGRACLDFWSCTSEFSRLAWQQIDITIFAHRSTRAAVNTRPFSPSIQVASYHDSELIVGIRQLFLCLTDIRSREIDCRPIHRVHLCTTKIIQRPAKSHCEPSFPAFPGTFLVSWLKMRRATEQMRMLRVEGCLLPRGFPWPKSSEGGCVAQARGETAGQEERCRNPVLTPNSSTRHKPASSLTEKFS